MLDARRLVGTHHILLMTLDTLRFDVAESVLRAGRTPVLQRLLPNGEWQRRHTPGNFTWAAHQAFFAGFLPTPATPGPHPRLFAARFHGSETTTEKTYLFDAPDLMTGLRQAGYHTICIGGVGFFNKQTALGRVFPDMFDESHWSPEMGVTNVDSPRHQFDAAREAIERMSGQKLFLFVNVSAMHQPNCHYLPGASSDGPESQGEALAYVDSCLPPLLRTMQAAGPWMCVVCSDHGTAYGEAGHVGHRCGHEVVWTVPYSEFLLPAESSA